MGFKMINNTSLSASIALLLVVLLSQAKLFNFLLETAWGRFILISVIIVISYLSKILGVVSVLFVIIMFNQSDIGFFEGFTNDENANSRNDNVSNSNAQKKLIASNANNNNNNNNNNEHNIKNSDKDKNNINKVNKLDKTTNENNQNTIKPIIVEQKQPIAKEGFDMIGTENNIKRGKQSNSIPVNNSINKADNVTAYEGFSNMQTFSAF